MKRMMISLSKVGALPLLCLTVQSSVPDPWHFETDLDPGSLNPYTGLQIRIPDPASVAFKTLVYSKVFLLISYSRYTYSSLQIL
jgi:hypothetical protein